MEKKDLLSMRDLSVDELGRVIELAGKIKKDPGGYKDGLGGRNMVLIFEKPSTRTRVSFEVSMLQLGGHVISITTNTSQFERGETVADSAKVLERYVDAIMARVIKHETLLELSQNSRVPVINGLSDIEHPCQIISDLLTIHEIKGSFEDVRIAYVGDGNNVCNSLILGCAMAGLELEVASPEKYMPGREVVNDSRDMAKSTGASIKLGNDPFKAVEEADFVYTDVWISMGQEAEKAGRMNAFADYQVNEELLSKAASDVRVMHCLPAHRGMEISGEVLDGPMSIVWDQAENRLHAQKAILMELIR
ncbi:MAG: ornithine carbamoyltransferase [Candidatus Altiarchaeota archaeon]|nr:ornithine carbamoyltransferase [Candidatus Altiarchaeota archaeon]